MVNGGCANSRVPFEVGVVHQGSRRKVVGSEQSVEVSQNVCLDLFGLWRGSGFACLVQVVG